MADGTIGRANVEIGANTAPLDADLAGVKSKVEKAAQGAEDSAQKQSAAKEQVAKTEVATAQKTNERLAAEIKITQETLKQAAAKKRAADDQARSVKHVSDNLTAGPDAGPAAGLGSESSIAGMASHIGSAATAIGAITAGLKEALDAARTLSNEFKSMGDSFGGDKMQFMGEMTKQIEQAKRAFADQIQQIQSYKGSLEWFFDWNNSKTQIMYNQLQNEMNAQLTRIMEAQKLKIKQQMLELTLEVRKFREEVNAASSIGTQPIELAAVSEAIRVLALRSETSR